MIGENVAWDLIRIVVAVSLLFVWVVRYSNIVAEFKEYQLPNWFRDCLGIIKCVGAVMLLTGQPALVAIASYGLIALMTAAFLMHIKHQGNKRQMKH